MNTQTRSATTIGIETSAWSPFRHSAFRMLWVAAVISNIGTWMNGMGAAWLMTSLSDRPLFVALVQTASALPMFLLALPAGALADIVDRRRYLLFVQIGMLIVAVTLTMLTWVGWTTPWLLLVLTFGLGIGAALTAPAWQATTPELVPSTMLPAAISLNSAGINVSRSIGPAIGGLIIAAAGPAAAFAINATSFLAIIMALYLWRREPHTSMLPAERFFSAMRLGVRYVRQSPPLKLVLMRTAIFFPFASALWALLPLIARTELNRDASGYGILLSVFGIGAVLGWLILPRLRRSMTSNRIVMLATLTFGIAMILIAVFKVFSVASVALLLAGMAWITVLSSLNIAVQQLVPNWVRARAVSIYIVVFFAGMTAGSAIWGEIASRFDIATALLIAACGLILSILITQKFPLSTESIPNLAPSMHWPAPETAEPLLTPEKGPVLVTVEYRVKQENKQDFMRAMNEVRGTRLRNGAYGWGLFKDVAATDRYIEYFIDESWIEHMRQHERVSVADREVQEQANIFHTGDMPPIVSHYLAQS